MNYSPASMHLPDGFLSLAISIFCWVVTVALVGLSIKRTERSLGERQVPLMGIMAAFIFAAQMINFPVPGGTSGHLLGGALASITLGPWAGMLVMTAVIAVQGLLFQDGGLLVMGANILNMGLLTVMVGYGLYRPLMNRNQNLKLGVIGLAAWLSIITGAFFTSLELWLSGTARLEIVLPAMLGWHAIIGLGEALITVAAVAFILKTRPDLLAQGSPSSSGGRGWIPVGILVALTVVLAAPLASSNPDGLNRVAMDLGFIHSAQSGAGPFAGYLIPVTASPFVSRVVAGALGVLVVLLLAFWLGRLVLRKQAH